MLPAHPRVCGADPSFSPASIHWEGSSPRVRGRRRQHHRRGGRPGLIPACAGQTVRWPLGSSSTTAHPRVCGAGLIGDLPPSGFRGSSPRVRGRLPRLRNRPAVRRLIPACAGQTHHHVRAAGTFRAHPRVCGADYGSVNPSIQTQGSSPRVRGRPTQASG